MTTRNQRIGLLIPSSNTTQEPEFWRMLPRGYSLHVARLPLTNITPDSTKGMTATIESESRKLADARVGVILLAATAPSSRMGIGYDQELIARITQATGIQATTAATATMQALASLNAKRITVGAAWSDEVNLTVVNFLQQNGITVLAHRALGMQHNSQVGDLDPQTALDMGLSLDRPDIDAVFLPCGNWKTLDILEPLEQQVKKPVLTTNQVSLWHALRLLGHTAPVPNLGVLLREHVMARAA